MSFYRGTLRIRLADGSTEVFVDQPATSRQAETRRHTHYVEVEGELLVVYRVTQTQRHDASAWDESIRQVALYEDAQWKTWTQAPG